MDAGGSGSMTWNGVGPVARTRADMPVPGQPGKTVPVDVTAKPIKSSAAAAIANFAKKVSPVGTAIAVFDLLSELGILRRDGADGENELYKPGGEPAWCYFAQGSGHPRTCYPTPEAICDAGTALFRSQGLPYYYEYEGPPDVGPYNTPAPYGGCNWMKDGVGRWGNGPIADREPLGGGSPERTLTEQEVADEIASQSGWPTSSKFPEAIAEVIKSGRPVEMDTPKVSGPATTPGPTKTETTTGPNGSTTTTTTSVTNNWTYNDNRVTVTTTTNVTTSTPEGTTTTEINEEDPKEDDVCKANPDRVGCAELDRPDGEIPRSSRALTYVAEALGLGGGTCPPPIVKQLGGQSVTVFSYAKGCELLETYVRPMILLVSAWIAFLILSPGAPGRADG